MIPVFYNNISPLIAQQFSLYLRTKSPGFVRLLELYHEFLESVQIECTIPASYDLTSRKEFGCQLGDWNNDTTVEGTEFTSLASLKYLTFLNTVYDLNTEDVNTVLLFLDRPKSVNGLFQESVKEIKVNDILYLETESTTEFLPCTITKINYQPLRYLRNLSQGLELQQLETFFIDQYSQELTAKFPKNIKIDQYKLLKYAKSIYKTKGSEESFRVLFQILYGEHDVSFYYPKEDVLRTSSGKWLEQMSLYTLFDTQISLLTNQTIIGTVSNARGTLSIVEDITVGGTLLYTIQLTNKQGGFYTNEVIQGVTSNATALFSGGIYIENINGDFITGETVIGRDSEAYATFQGINEETSPISRILKLSLESQQGLFKETELCYGFNGTQKISFNIYGTTNKLQSISDPEGNFITGTIGRIESEYGIQASASVGLTTNDQLLILDVIQGGSYYQLNDPVFFENRTDLITQSAVAHVSGLTDTQVISHDMSKLSDYSNVQVLKGNLTVPNAIFTHFRISDNVIYNQGEFQGLICDVTSDNTDESLKELTVYWEKKINTPALNQNRDFYIFDSNAETFIPSIKFVQNRDPIPNTQTLFGLIGANQTVLPLYTISDNSVYADGNFKGVIYSVTTDTNNTLLKELVVVWDLSGITENLDHTVAFFIFDENYVELSPPLSFTQNQFPENYDTPIITIEDIGNTIFSDNIVNLDLTIGSVSELTIDRTGKGYRYDPTMQIWSELKPFAMIDTPGNDAQISVNTKGGTILEIELQNTGYVSSTEPRFKFISERNNAAYAVFSSIGYSTQSGYYLDGNGQLSSSKRLQNEYYQDYSYVVQSAIAPSVWKPIIEPILHPAGYDVLGQILLNLFLNLRMHNNESNDINSRLLDYYSFRQLSIILAPNTIQAKGHTFDRNNYIFLKPTVMESFSNSDEYLHLIYEPILDNQLYKDENHIFDFLKNRHSSYILETLPISIPPDLHHVIEKVMLFLKPTVVNTFSTSDEYIHLEYVQNLIQNLSMFEGRATVKVIPENGLAELNLSEINTDTINFSLASPILDSIAQIENLLICTPPENTESVSLFPNNDLNLGTRYHYKQFNVTSEINTEFLLSSITDNELTIEKLVPTRFGTLDPSTNDIQTNSIQTLLKQTPPAFNSDATMFSTNELNSYEFHNLKTSIVLRLNIDNTVNIQTDNLLSSETLAPTRFGTLDPSITNIQTNSSVNVIGQMTPYMGDTTISYIADFDSTQTIPENITFRNSENIPLPDHTIEFTVGEVIYIAASDLVPITQSLSGSYTVKSVSTNFVTLFDTTDGTQTTIIPDGTDLLLSYTVNTGIESELKVSSFLKQNNIASINTGARTYVNTNTPHLLYDLDEVFVYGATGALGEFLRNKPFLIKIVNSTKIELLTTNESIVDTSSFSSFELTNLARLLKPSEILRKDVYIQDLIGIDMNMTLEEIQNNRITQLFPNNNPSLSSINNYDEIKIKSRGLDISPSNAPNTDQLVLFDDTINNDNKQKDFLVLSIDDDQLYCTHSSNHSHIQLGQKIQPSFMNVGIFSLFEQPIQNCNYS